jgi:quinol monooxygenase YgiN
MHVVVATIKGKAGQGAELEKAALALAEAVNKNEEGCLQYIVCKGENPDEVVFVERYRDDAALEAHRKSDHFRTLGKAMGAFMDGAPSILRMKQVSPE